VRWLSSSDTSGNAQIRTPTDVLHAYVALIALNIVVAHSLVHALLSAAYCERRQAHMEAAPSCLSSKVRSGTCQVFESRARNMTSSQLARILSA
jgi:hypothetical protein